MQALPAPIQIEQTIQGLERRHLDNATSVATPIWGELENIPFLRVLGQSAFWRTQKIHTLEQCMDDLVSSAYGQGLDLFFLVISQNHRNGIYFGTQNVDGQDNEAVLRTLLMASFPGIVLEGQSDKTLGRTLNAAGFFVKHGRMTGIPTRKTRSYDPDHNEDSQQSIQGALQIDRILRGLRGETWGFLVRASSSEYGQIIKNTNLIIKDIESIARLTKHQVQDVRQTLHQVDPITQTGETQSISSEIVNRLAERAVELLERQLERLESGKNVGMWQVNAHYFSGDDGSLRRCQALLRAVFGGVSSVPEPVRLTNCGSAGLKAQEFTSSLTSIELSTLVQLPREEVPGYRILDYAPFDVDQRVNPSQESVALGAIIDQGQITPLMYAIPKSQLNRHALITGVTGSGKTTTIFSLLDGLWNRTHPSIPFMVIEPTKSEYRSFLEKKQEKSQQGIPLKIFTLGDETVSPFRINPFEFEILDSDHFTHVQTHIDYLKSVFNAAFVLYAPMPYVLEICLHEVYMDKGWDLTISRNLRLDPSHWGQVGGWPVFPTLQDLYNKVDKVTERLGYEERIKMDVKAGLKTRLESLMLGGKGLMLNTSYGIPIAELLKQPVVLELERIGNDEEKTFLMGLILTRLYEYRRLQAGFSYPIRFQHLTVIEEAHRLLRNVPLDSGPDTANMRGQAVETFANLLAEIRAYGEGILISEQIPSKLTPDAIKNTNLKITHRTIAEDDRSVIAGATNMNDDQARFLAVLNQGQAVIFSEGDDHPVHVEIADLSSRAFRSRPSDQEVRQLLTGITYPYWINILPQSIKAEIVKEISDLTVWAQTIEQLDSVLHNPNFLLLWNGFILNILVWSEIRADFYAPLDNLVRQMVGKKTQSASVLKKLLMVSATYTSFQERGHLYDWNFEDTNDLWIQCVQGLVLFATGDLIQANHLLTEFRKNYYQKVSTLKGPFIGCEFCEDRCLYRFDLLAIAQENTFRSEWMNTIRIHKTPESLWKDLALMNQDRVHHFLVDVPQTITNGLSICLAAQTIHSLQFSFASQTSIMQGIYNAIMTPRRDAA